MRILMLILTFTALTSGCFHSPNIGGNDNLKDIDFSTSANWKRGESCDTYLLGFIGPIADNGGNSIIAAAATAKIKKVYIVEYELFAPVLGVSYCTIVYGE